MFGSASQNARNWLNMANPDLVERLRTGAPFNDADPAAFYGGGEKGYTDYPRLAD